MNLTKKQSDALKLFRKTWQRCPHRVHISVLMSLKKRGLVECRTSAPYIPGMPITYKWDYLWRLVSAKPTKGADRE